MKNLNESLLDSIELIEEMEIKSELDVIIAIGNQYAKVGMISEYAESDPNEYDIIQESTLFMEANAAKEGASKASKVWEKIRKVFHAIFKAIKKACMWIAKQFKKLGKGIKNIFTGKDDKKKDKSKDKEKAEKLVEDLKKTIDECKDKKEDEISDSDINKVIHQAESTVKQVKQIIMSASPEVKQAAAALEEGQKKGNRINDEIAKAYKDQQNKKDSDDKKEPLQIEDKGEAKSSAKSEPKEESKPSSVKEEPKKADIVNDLDKLEEQLSKMKTAENIERRKSVLLRKLRNFTMDLQLALSKTPWHVKYGPKMDRQEFKKIMADCKKKQESKALTNALKKLKAEYPNEKYIVFPGEFDSTSDRYLLVFYPKFTNDFIDNYCAIGSGNNINEDKKTIDHLIKQVNKIYHFEKQDVESSDIYNDLSQMFKRLDDVYDRFSDSKRAKATDDDYKTRSDGFRNDITYDEVFQMLKDQLFPKVTEATDEIVAYGTFITSIWDTLGKLYDEKLNKNSGSDFHFSNDD